MGEGGREENVSRIEENVEKKRERERGKKKKVKRGISSSKEDEGMISS